MGSVRNWAAGSAIPTLILLSPVGAFFMILTAEVLIDGLMEAGVTGCLPSPSALSDECSSAEYGARIARLSG
jgi:hypothetical protein